MDGAAPPIEPLETACPVLIELRPAAEVCVETLDWPLAGMVWVALPPGFAVGPPCRGPPDKDKTETGLSTDPCWATPAEM